MHVRMCIMYTRICVYMYIYLFVSQCIGESKRHIGYKYRLGSYIIDV